MRALLWILLLVLTVTVRAGSSNFINGSVIMNQVKWVNLTNTLHNYRLDVQCPTETVKVTIFNNNRQVHQTFCRTKAGGFLSSNVRYLSTEPEFDIRDRINISISFTSSSVKARFGYRLDKSEDYTDPSVQIFVLMALLLMIMFITVNSSWISDQYHSLKSLHNIACFAR